MDYLKTFIPADRSLDYYVMFQTPIIHALVARGHIGEDLMSVIQLYIKDHNERALIALASRCSIFDFLGWYSYTNK